MRVSAYILALVASIGLAPIALAQSSGLRAGAGDTGIRSGGGGAGVAATSDPLHFEELGEDVLASDFSTTSTSLTAITGLSVTFEALEGERVLVTAGLVHANTAGQGSFSVTIDGVDPDRGGEQRRAGQIITNHLCVLSQDLSAGSVTVQPTCATSTGTIDIDATATNNVNTWLQVVGVRGDSSSGDLVRLGQDLLSPSQTINSTSYAAVTNLSLTVTAAADERLLVVCQPMTAFELDGATVTYLDLRVGGSTLSRAIQDFPVDAGGNSGSVHGFAYLTEPQSEGSVTFQLYAATSASDSFQVFASAVPGRSSLAVYAIRAGSGSGWSLLAADDFAASGDFATSSTSAATITGLSGAFTANDGEDAIIVCNWVSRNSSSVGTNKIDIRVDAAASNDGAFENVQTVNANEWNLRFHCLDGLSSGSRSVDAIAYTAGGGTTTVEADTGNNGLSGFQVIGVR